MLKRIQILLSTFLFLPQMNTALAETNQTENNEVSDAQNSSTSYVEQLKNELVSGGFYNLENAQLFTQQVNDYQAKQLLEVLKTKNIDVKTSPTNLVF